MCLVLAGRGLVLKALPLVSKWNTNREEHNLITGAHPHTCFHCKAPAHLKDTVGEWPLIDSTNAKGMIAEATTTGEYGGDKWRLKYTPSAKKALPILASETWPDELTHHNVVQSWERYDHFCVRADLNPLHDLPHCNLNQICRDDMMHCVLCGMIKYLLAALLSHIIM